MNTPSSDVAKRSRETTVALVQMGCDRSPRANLDWATTQTRAAVDQGADLVCLPELFLSPYFCQVEDHTHFDSAEPIDGPTTSTLAALAGELSVVILATIFERRAAGIYHNTCVAIDADGSIAGYYRKMHIPDDPQYFEKFYFTPGDTGFRAFDTRAGRIGVLICWDQWFPEAARMTALAGAEILLYPTAIGWFPEEKSTHGATQHDSWRTMQRSHAIANGCFVAAVNRVGFERAAVSHVAEGIEFWGQSFICDTQGKILSEASATKEEIVIATVDLSDIDRTRTAWPFLRDRRIDAYQALNSRFGDVSPFGTSNH